MLAQYWDLKKKYPDAILFYRMGDFYEMFFDDAVVAAPVLEVQLTSRDKSAENPIAMCGVPYHAVGQYLQKLVAAGYKVAICEQMEDPASTKGLVRRDVVRVVTPALIADPDLVSEESRNYLACLSAVKGKFVAVALLDLLSGERRVGTVDRSGAVVELLQEWKPKEILLSDSLSREEWMGEVFSRFPEILVTRREAYFQSKQDGETATITAIQSYLEETQKIPLIPHLSVPQSLHEPGALKIDLTTSRALEILKSSVAENGPSLFGILNHTLTPMGRRLLKDWLVRPLYDGKKIEQRLDAVDTLVCDSRIATEFKTLLTPIRDLERLATKTALGLGLPRDLVAIREILKTLPEIQRILRKADTPLFLARCEELNPLSDLVNHLESALVDEPPSTLREGGIFRETFHPDIADLRSASRDAKSTIAAIETREREKTGISSLKIRYSKVFGYTIEVTKSQLGRVPSAYIRKQTIANGERYITEELKAFEEKAVSAEHRLRSLEEGLFLELRQKVAAEAGVLHRNAQILAELDVLLSFSKVARERGYHRPQFTKGWDLHIEEGRHPVVEALLPTGKFVPNSVSFSSEACRTILLTGPNMGGKSTVMRQTALIALMAHAGSFVPAKKARLPLIDAIFTRIGSSDDLAAGRSTFMVEMTEVARILCSASKRSLILIDEIGRGTSTYDGLSLAWSLLEYLHKETQAKTLFATHFHELTVLENSLPALLNANVLVEKWKDEVVFLYKLAPGICNRSYGIEVARLAGLPRKVLSRARDLLGLLETQSRRADRTRSRALEIHDNQMAFFDSAKPSETQTGLET